MEQFDIKELLETHPLLDIDCQHLNNNLPDLLRNFCVMEDQRLSFDIVEYIDRTFALPRQTLLQPLQRSIMILLVVEHQVENKPQRPNIRFLGIGLIIAHKHLQYFRTGKERGAYEGTYHLVLLLHLGRAKISNFDLIILDEYIRRLDIAMQYVLLVHKSDPLHDLRVVMHHLVTQILLLVECHQQILQGATFAELHH